NLRARAMQIARPTCRTRPPSAPSVPQLHHSLARKFRHAFCVLERGWSRLRPEVGRSAPGSLGSGPRGRPRGQMMREDDLYFVIPPYRWGGGGETVEQYDEHFGRNGHAVRMIVFDDSTPATQEKYYGLLEQTRTHNELYYVGPREKELFLAYLNRRLRDRRLEALVKNLFRPSYGGNRNFPLMYTLGGLMVSADDDMRPYTLMEDSPESLGADEVCRGKLLRSGQNGFTRKSFDILTPFLDVLGKHAGQVPANYDRGEVLVDTAMDLETN